MNHTKIRALLNESQDLLLVEKKRGGFWNSVKKTLGTIAGLGLAGAGAYAGLKYFKPHMLQGLKNKYIAPLQASGLKTAIGDADTAQAAANQALQDDIAKAEAEGNAGIRRDLGDPNKSPNLAARNRAAEEKQRLKDELEKKERRQLEETTQVNDVKNFINELGQKNYSEADKYLKKVVEDKLQSKIKDQYTKQKLY